MLRQADFDSQGPEVSIIAGPFSKTKLALGGPTVLAVVRALCQTDSVSQEPEVLLQEGLMFGP